MSRRQIKPRLATPTPRRVSRRKIKTRLAMPVPPRNKMLLHNRPRARNPARHRSPRKKSRKIRQTLAGGLDRATPVAEAAVPGKVVQNHLEPGIALLDRRHRPRPTRRRLPQERLRGKHRQNRRASHGNDHVVNLKEVLQVVRKKKLDCNAKACIVV
jgi:hypothetical protein